MPVDEEKIEPSLAVVNAPVASLADTDLKFAGHEVDGALAFLRNEADVGIAELDEKRLLRKIDWLIMPILFGVYVLQFVDKSLSMYSTVKSVRWATRNADLAQSTMPMSWD